MPIVLPVGSYQFGFFAADRDEPPHVHVKHGRKRAKFWLHPLGKAKAGRFKAHELNRIEQTIREHHAELMEAWHDFFNR
jgi:hypothetical protein